MKKNIILLFFATGFFISNLPSQTYYTINTYTGTTTPGLVDGPIASALFYHPYSLCTDPVSGAVYVADTYNNCIRKIVSGMVTTYAGNGTAGDVDAQGTNARFNGPAGLTFSNGDLFITDNGNNKIKKIDANGNVTTIAGTGAPGFLDGPAAQAQFYNPFDVKVSSIGDLIIADYYNHCIRKISNGVVSTIAGVGGVLGDQTGPAASAKFERPRSICFDGFGNLYIADMINNKIKVLTPGGMVNLVAGSGAAGSQDGTGTGATFNNPLGVEMDMWGNVIIADGLSNKIRRTTPSGVVTTIAGTGVAGYLDGPCTTAELYVPAGLGLINGKIYIVDVFNNCIRYLDKADVSVYEFSCVEQLTIYSYSTADEISIVDPSKGNDHLSVIFIFSIDGKLLREIKIETTSTNIDVNVADLPTGMYFINAISEEQKKYSSKFIKE